MKTVSDGLARWVGLLRWAQRGLLVVAVLLGCFALLLILTDESDHGDDWDGFGTWIGLMVAEVAVIAIVVAGVLLSVTKVAWRRAVDRGTVGLLRFAAGLTVAAAAGWFFVALSLASDVEDPRVVVALFVPFVVLLWPACMVLLVATRAPFATIRV